MSDQLINRHRPASFDVMYGQDKAIAAYLAAEKHARSFIFAGPSGVGKTTMARIAAAMIGAEVLEHNAAKFNGVEAMSEITDMFDRHPLLSTAIRAIIIDECHRITQAGWSLLLKPLEDAPDWLRVYLCTTELGKVPDTIRGQRCPVIQLQDVGTDDLVTYLSDCCDREEWDETPDEVLALCARNAFGSPRRALTLLGSCHDCIDRKTAAERINVTLAADESPDGLAFQLARTIAAADRAGVQSVLRKIKKHDEHPEGVRHIVRAYFEKVMLSADSDRVWGFATKVLYHFAEPIPDMPALCLAVGQLI